MKRAMPFLSNLGTVPHFMRHLPAPCKRLAHRALPADCPFYSQKTPCPVLRHPQDTFVPFLDTAQTDTRRPSAPIPSPSPAHSGPLQTSRTVPAQVDPHPNSRQRLHDPTQTQITHPMKPTPGKTDTVMEGHASTPGIPGELDPVSELPGGRKPEFGGVGSPSTCRRAKNPKI